MAGGARGAALWVVAAVGYLVLEAVAAASFEPDYSYARNYISDLGTPAASHAYLMWAAFSLQGILFLLGVVLIVGVPDNPRARAFLGTVAINAVGNIVIAFVHSGKVHVAGAVLAIAGGNAAIATGGTAIRALAGRRWYRRVSEGAAVFGFSCLVMLTINAATTTAHLVPDAVWERGSVYSITGWQLLTAGTLLTRTRERRPARGGR